MLSNKILALTILLIGSSSICCATQCPHNDDVTSKIEVLANDGKAMIGDKTYHLIGRDETGIFYQEKLLSNDAQLNGFLKVTKVFEPNLPNKAEAHLLPLLPTPNFWLFWNSRGIELRLHKGHAAICLTKRSRKYGTNYSPTGYRITRNYLTRH